MIRSIQAEPGRYIQIEFRTFGPLLRLWSRLTGFGGIMTPWRVCYLSKRLIRDERIIRHELEHALQMERDGRVVFLWRYLRDWIRFGYRDIPYEIEARAAETDYGSSL